MIDDVVMVLERLDLRSAVVVGHSMGVRWPGHVLPVERADAVADEIMRVVAAADHSPITTPRADSP